MKSRKTKKTMKTKKTRRVKKPLQTTARYVYWYACAHPGFGNQLLIDPAGAMKKHLFEMSPGEMEILTGYLNKDQRYVVSARQLLEGVCELKDRDPGKAPPQLQETAPVPEPMISGQPLGLALRTLGDPPPPPPPWG